MSPEERKEILAARREEKEQEGILYAVRRFKLLRPEVVGYHSGCCYSKVWVTNRAAAEKVAAAVADGEVNGGFLHGMSLGGITEVNGIFEVMV